MDKPTADKSAVVKPNLYQLQGESLHVTFSTSGIDGKPHFTYQDRHETLNFRGDEIRSAETEIGTVVSVSIRRTVDSGSTTFSLLVPNVNLGKDTNVHVVTLGITTVHRFSMIPAFNQGQTETYAVTTLNGSARMVMF